MFPKSKRHESRGHRSARSSKSHTSKNVARRWEANSDNESESVGTGISKSPQEWPAQNDGNGFLAEGWDDDRPRLQAEHPSPSYMDDPGQDPEVSKSSFLAEGWGGDRPLLQDEHPSPRHMDDPGQDPKTEYSHHPASGHNYPRFPSLNFPSPDDLSRSFYIPSPQTQQDQYVSGSSYYNPGPRRQQPRQSSYTCEDDSYQMSSSQDIGTTFGYAETTYNTAPQQTSSQVPTAKSQLSSNSVTRGSSRFEHFAQDGSFSEVDAESEYETITKPGGYFKPGRIFRKKAEGANEDVQTFVVLQDGKESAICAPLKNYDVDSSTYEDESRPLVYATGVVPQLGPGKDRPMMGQFPVFVERSSQRIDPKSRLDFSAALTIDHRAKVQTVGRIDRNYVKELKSTFLESKGAKLPEAGFSDAEGSGITEDNLHVTASEMDLLHPEFKVHPAREFRFGRVFKMLWTEPGGQKYPSVYSDDESTKSSTKHGEEIYTSIRRFVIIKLKEGHCLCLPILTYQRQATTKRGVKAQDHAIIYTRTKTEGQRVKEIAGEQKLLKTPIRMEPSSRRNQLDPSSRLNYAKIYTVEYNVKVCFIGAIHKESVKYLNRDYNVTHEPLPEAADVPFRDGSEIYDE